MRISVVAVAFGAVLSAGGCSKLGLGDSTPTAPSGPPSAGSSILYAAVGASDANGVGSSIICPPFTDCPNGTGYVFVAARQLQAQGFKVTTTNMGIPTAVIGPSFQALGQRYGRDIFGNFIDQELPFISPDATVVTIFAGGNDVNTITAAIGAGAAGTDQAGYIDQQIRAFGADYATLVAGIRSRAPAARLVVFNLPNLAGLPYLATASLAQRQAARSLSVGMTTTVINALTSQGVAVVDLMCDPRLYQRSTFSSDGFHPNDGGYLILAAEIVKAVTSSSYPAPQSSCSFMTLLSS